MKKDVILKALREAGTPITTEELARMTGIDIVRLRIDLYHLVEEGKVEKRMRGNTPVWTVKLSSFLERP